MTEKFKFARLSEGLRCYNSAYFSQFTMYPAHPIVLGQMPLGDFRDNGVIGVNHVADAGGRCLAHQLVAIG